MTRKRAMALDSNTHSPSGGSSSTGTLPNGFFARNAGVLLSTPIWKGSRFPAPPRPTRGRLDAVGAARAAVQLHALRNRGEGGGGRGEGARGTSANQRRAARRRRTNVTGEAMASASAERGAIGTERKGATSRGWRLARARATRARGARARREARRDAATRRRGHAPWFRAGSGARNGLSTDGARAVAGARNALPLLRRTGRRDKVGRTPTVTTATPATAIVRRSRQSSFGVLFFSSLP